MLIIEEPSEKIPVFQGLKGVAMETPFIDEHFLSDNQKAALAAEDDADAIARGESLKPSVSTDAAAKADGVPTTGPLRFEIPVSLPAEIRSEEDMVIVMRR